MRNTLMQKELTKFETLTTKTNVTYYKVHFGSQWFMVTPWHYSKAKLMPQYELISKCVEGKSYDIKWRVATIGSNKVTFLTQCTLCEEEEFSWDGEEQGGEDSSQAPSQALPQKASNHTPYKEEQLPLPHMSQFDDDYDLDDLDGCPF